MRYDCITYSPSISVHSVVVYRFFLQKLRFNIEMSSTKIEYFLKCKSFDRIRVCFHCSGKFDDIHVISFQT